MMKKQIVIAIITAALLSMAGLAQAGNSNRGHGNSHSRGYSTSHHNRSHYGNSRRHYGNSRRHYRGAYGHNNYRHHGGGHYNYYNGLEIVAGALVVGSIINAVNSRPTRVVTTETRPYVPAEEYWYRVDADGQCVEVRLNDEGREVWTYVDSAYCN